MRGNMIHSDEKWEQLRGEKKKRWMGSVVWKRRVPQKVLEKHGMKKKKSVKSKLRSAERGGVEEYRMKLRSVKSGGVGKCGIILRRANPGSSVPMGWRSASPRRGVPKGVCKNCGMHNRGPGGN
jgi:hypothetical protein